MKTEVLNKVPLLRTSDNFLTKEICEKIIELSRPLLVESKVVGKEGSSIMDYSIRSSQVVSSNSINELSTIEVDIAEKVSHYTGYSVDQFEQITIHRYGIGDEFKLHQDYFIEYDDPVAQENHNSRCALGGNRISTVIIYLNNVDAGGKTWFPWINQLITPEQGKLVHFDYCYDDWLPNIQTQHHGLPVEGGEKWILTIWIRERSRTEGGQEFKRFTEETNIYKKIVDIDYDLEVGPDWDRRTLNLSLPGNNNPENALIVGFTGGMDSSLLLYLIAVLNTHQLIPYQIVPVLVKNSSPDMQEDEHRARLMLSWIRSETNSKVRNLQIVSSDCSSIRESMVDGLMHAFKGLPESPHYNPVLIYTGVNELPDDGDKLWEDINWKRMPSPYDFWLTPFFKLQKYHLLDAILKLEIDALLVYMGKCAFKHKTLDEECQYFACNERRWAFRKLGINNLGDKYLTYRR